MDLGIAGRKAIVCASSRGLGRACATRLAEAGCEVVVNGLDPKRLEETANAIRDVTSMIEAQRFNDAASTAYHFVYDIFCDWYVEITKPIFQTGSEAAKAETRATTAWARDQILKLLHPFMPFITEELWARTSETPRDSLLILAEWPKPLTIDGAVDLGLADKTGSLTPGKRADVILLRTTDANMSLAGDPYETLI